MLTYALLFGVSLVLCLVLTPPVRALAHVAGALDKPDGRRKLHALAIPRLGGIGVFAAFYLSLWLVAAWLQAPDLNQSFQLASAMLLPSLLVLALGIADDLWSVKPWMKLTVQIVAGLLIYFHLGIRIESVTSPFETNAPLAALSLPATLFWIVLVTNAFNIVDGMDGLAAGVCFIALSCMFLVSLQGQRAEIALVVAPLAGAVLGFLKYNFSPASIFLGDSGSLFLGFQLAVLSMVGSQKSSTAIAVTAPLFILALPLVETAVSTFRRFLSGRSIIEGDAGHIHHRLTRLGFTPRRAVGMLYIGSAVFGLTSLFIIQSNSTTVGLIALFLAAVTWVAIQRLGYSEFAELNSALKRFVNQRRIIQNSIVSRKLADDLKNAHSEEEAWTLVRRAARQLGFSSVELNVETGASDPKTYSQQLSAVLPSGGGETSFAVSLNGTRGALGQVRFSRALAAPPLHSELPLLINAVAQGLPPLLERRLPPLASPFAFTDFDLVAHNEPIEEPSSAASGAEERQSALTCPSCSSENLVRAKSRPGVERIRKNLTAKRVHKCLVCGWRGWVIPAEPSSHEATMVHTFAAPNLQAIDLAIAGSRYDGPPSLMRPGSRFQ